MAKKADSLGLSRIEKSPDIPTMVAKQIIDLISSGKLKPGDKLPSEQAMTDLFGISRISLREALKLLEAKEYIESLDRKGKFVKSMADNVKSPIEDMISIDHEKIWELLAVRRILDSEMAAFAAVNAKARQLKELREIVKRMQEIGTDDVLISNESGKLYSDIFDVLADSTKNTIFVHLRQTIATILKGAFPYSRQKLSTTPGSSKEIFNQMIKICEAVEKRDPDAAKAATIEHIDYIVKTLKKVLKGLK